jgi:acetyl-CoA C-acetyltransferase
MTTPAPDPIVIVGAARTPLGGLMGDLRDLAAPRLGAAAIAAALGRAGLAPDTVDTALMGCVLAAGLGQAPARQAALGAGLPLSCGCTTVNKMCGSGMQAAILAHDQLLAGSASVAVAGGMESMTNAPHLLGGLRRGWRMGGRALEDHMLVDGLEDAYQPGRAMGSFAEDCAEAYGFSRERQDDWALASLTRARAATADGAFAAEIVPLAIAGAEISRDEQPAKADPDRIRTLKPAFRDGGTVTAANSSSISDGAAALVLMRRSEAEARGVAPLAVIRGHAAFADRPELFPTAPIGAIRRLLERVGWSRSDVDLWEVNEAFAVVTLAAMAEFGLPGDAVNVHGGACALGHPIGASGARIVVTLLAALARHGLRTGIAALCIGGGEATALAIERGES